jgi:hypothetical protein
MPTCHLTLAGHVPELCKEEMQAVRDIVANGLNSSARLLDRNHVVIRVQRADREHMLADIEVEVFCQFFVRRFFSRDKRAESISKGIKELLGYDCATWINMMVVGYARATIEGKVYFSDKASQSKKN